MARMRERPPCAVRRGEAAFALWDGAVFGKGMASAMPHPRETSRTPRKGGRNPTLWGLTSLLCFMASARAWALALACRGIDCFARSQKQLSPRRNLCSASPIQATERLEWESAEVLHFNSSFRFVNSFSNGWRSAAEREVAVSAGSSVCATR